MAQNVVPFGKYKGQAVEALAADREYTDWLMGQSWFKDRYQNIYTEPSETPEHNALQALFLDDVFAQWVVFVCHRKAVADVISRASAEAEDDLRWRVIVGFEVMGADVLIQWLMGWTYMSGDNKRESWSVAGGAEFRVEIKPSLGDDYPAVLRQIRNIKCPGKPILFIERYNGIGATFEQVVDMFWRAGIRIVTLAEVRVAMDGGDE